MHAHAHHQLQAHGAISPHAQHALQVAQHTLNHLGWRWCTNGAVICVQIDQHRIEVFVPLNRIWAAIEAEMAKAGAPFAPHVGAQFSVSGLFGSIVHAITHNPIAHVLTHNPIAKAASNVVSTAGNFAAHALAKIPVVGPLANTVIHLASTPMRVVDQLAAGGRIDRIAMDALKSNLKDIKAVAPYAQTVLSMVPGIGSGLSGAIGAGLALASGQPITAALEAGLRGALPGGVIAQKAFDVASAAIAGKPIDQIALAALPISPAARTALVDGVHLASQLAAGKNVSQSVIDAATHQLPPDIAKAVQIGASLAHAKNLQDAAGSLVHAAGLVGAVNAGNEALSIVKSMPIGAAISSTLSTAMNEAKAAQAQLDRAHVAASAGNSIAQNLMHAVQMHVQANPPPVHHAPQLRQAVHHAPMAYAPPAHPGALVHFRPHYHRAA